MKFHAEHTKGFDTGQMLRYYQEIERLKDETRDPISEQRNKDFDEADRKEEKLEKHLNTKIHLTVENLRNMFEDIPNNARLEIIKSLIWTAPNAQTMWQLVCDKIANKKFGETID
jgi:hypothetical protein